MTLGEMIKAGRLRWGRLPHAEGLMRLSSTARGYLCEFHPLGRVPTERRVGDREYVIWWPGDHGRALIGESRFLRSLRKIKKPFSVVLNEAGEVSK